MDAFSREWNQVHKPREDECNKRLDQFEKVNLDIKPCTASSKHCVSRSETLDNRRTKVANIKRQLAECKRWWQEGEAWKAQFRAFSKQVKAETEQCDRKRAEIRAELKQYQAEWQVWKQQRAGLDSEREALDEDYETCLQEKSDLRARIVTMQEELESIQPVAGHCRTDDCPKLGFPQAGLDDFAHTVGDTYLAMAGPGGKLKTGKKVADAVAKLKPINLPSWRKIEIDMDHIVSGHQRGGARIMKNSNRSIFPEYMSRDEIERTIRQAYRYGKRIETQENRIHVRGNGIDIWINKITKKIVTAYPSAN